MYFWHNGEQMENISQASKCQFGSGKQYNFGLLYVRERDGYKYEDFLSEPPLVNFRVENVPRPNMYAREMRDRFARYFIEEGKLPWQDKMV